MNRFLPKFQIGLKQLLLLTFLVTASAIIAQPSVIGTQLVNGSYSTTNLNTVGGFRQVRLQATSSASVSTRNWEFASGTAATTDYSTNWRPLNTNNTLSLNTYIPTSFANGALYHTGFGGNSGLLPAITSGNYYTFNVTANPSSDNVMSLLETTYSPVTISSVSQANGTYASRTVTITTSGTPNAAENIYVRYSTDSYANSTIVQATGSGTTWTATIPWQSSAVSFYVYTSNKSVSAINADVVANSSQTPHDMATLSLNNNAGSNYVWTPATGAIIVTSTAGTLANTPTGYATFTIAGGVFTVFNTGTAHTGTVTALVTANVTTETGAVALNNSSNWTSLGIQPRGARTVSGTVASNPMLDINGGDNITVNGLNTGGNSLTISNLSTGAAGTSTIRFQTDAVSNTVTNCTVLGSSTSAVGSNGGNIWFGSGSSSTGNDNNTISNCNIGPAGANLPSKCLYFTGTSNTNPGTANSGITISGNNIYDYFIAGATSAGIDLNSGTVGTAITSNNFYQTASRTQTTASNHTAIYITNTNGAYTITGNAIGFATYLSATGTGSATAGAGSGKYSFVGVSGSVFTGMYLNVGSTTATSVQGNTLSDIAVSGAMNSTASPTAALIPYKGIFVVAGLTTIGNVMGNTIGSMSATGNITYTSSSTVASDVIGIYNFSTDNQITNNNSVGGMAVSNSSTGASNLYGIRTGATTNWTCTGNTIGGTVANSMNSTSTAAGTLVIGLYYTTASGAGALSNNIIRNMTVAGGTGTAAAASMSGITVTATGNQTLTQNTISNLSNTLTGSATVVNGIYMAGSTNTVERNLIHTLTSSTAITTAQINGIYAALGTTTYKNNMIALGAGVANAIPVNGLNEQGGTNTFLHNSVYIGGTVTAGAGSSSAFITGLASGTRVVRDNIFSNARANSGGTGKNYNIRLGTSASGLTINNNVYYNTGSGTVFGQFNASDVTTFANWQTTVGQDAVSYNGDPAYNAPTASTPDLHIHATNASYAEGTGTDLGVTDDYDGQTRSGLTPVDIGADAGNFTSSIAACVAPTTQSATFTPGATTSTTIVGSFAAASPVPSGYLVVRSSGTFSGTLVDGTAYATGNTIGNGTVIQSGTGLAISTSTGIISNTAYTITVFTYNNTACSGGPKYRTTSPLTGTLTTCPVAPTLPTNTSVGSTGFTANWTASAAGGSAGTINYTLEIYNDSGFTSPVTGIGSPFSTGTTVTQAVSGLTPSTTYYYRVKANNGFCDSPYLTTGTVTTTCGAITTFPSVTTFASYLPNVCWFEGTGGSITAGATTTGDATTSDWQEYGFVNVGTTGAANFNIYSDTANAWLITPYYTIPATNFRVKYNVGATQYNSTAAPTTAWESDDSVQLLVSTGNTNWTVLKTYNSANVPSNLGQIDATSLTAYNGQTVHFAFRVVEGASNGSADIDFFVDDFTIELTPTPVVITPASTTICNGDSVTLTASSTNTNYVYTWSPSTGLNTTSGAVVNANPTTTTTYTLSAVDGTMSTTQTVTVTVNPSPTAVSVSPTSAAVCNGTITSITATGGIIPQASLTELANSVPTTFTLANTTGTSTATLNTTYYSEGTGSVLFNTVSSPANVQYASNTNIDLSDATTAQLTFSHIAALEGSSTSYDIGYVEYSINGGTSWTTFPSSSYAGSGTLITTQGASTAVSGVIFSTRSYSDWTTQFTAASSTPGTGPATSLWKSETINVPAAALTSTQFRIRFRYSTDSSTLYYGWLLDNIKITKNAQGVKWTPSTGLYTDAAASTAYNSSNYAAKVYAKPIATTTYTATAIIGSCSKTATSVITVTAAPNAGTLSGTQAVCTNGTTTFTSNGDAGSWSSGTPAVATINASTGVVTPVSAGSSIMTYTVTGTGGCSNATATRTVTVTTAPNAGTLSGTQAICSNGTTTFTSNGSAGSWSSGTPAVATINALTGVVTPVSAGSSIMTYTVTGTGPCANATATRTVTVTAAPNPGILSGTQAICSNGTTTFSSNGDAGSWSSGTPAVATINASTGVVTPVSAGSSIMAYTVTGTGPCANATATRTVTVTTAPNAGTLSGTQSICSNGTTTFTSNGDTGSWSSGNNSVATINPSTGVITPVAAGTATMTYTVTGTGPCANATAIRTVTVTAGPNAGTLSGTQSICSNGSTTFISNGNIGGTFTSNNTGVATVDSSTGVITPVAAGTATITYTVTGTGPCSNATATRTVTVTVAPNAGTLSGTQSICSNGTTTFTSNGDSGSWSSSDTGVANVNASTGLITPVAAGTATITYTVTGSGPCANATATRTVTVTAAPNAGTLSGTQSICSNGTTTFTSNGDSGSWSSSDTNVATINPSTGVVIPVATGTATMTYTVTGSGPCANATVTRTVTVTAAPNAGTLSGTQSICSNGTTTFTSNGDTGSWSSSDTNVATINPSTGVITPVAAGTATITYTITGTGPCANATATRTVTVTAAPNAGTLSGTQSICSNGTTAFTSNGDTGSWSSSDTNVATINPSTGVVTPVAAGTATMTYTVTGSGPCANATATRTVTITAAPNAGTLSGTQSICSNGTTTFTSNGDTGTWTSSDPGVATINASTGVVTPVAAGTATMTYTVTGTGPCANATATRTVTVLGLPTAAITGNSGAATCSGGTISFTLSGTSGAVVTYTINSGTPTTVTLTGGTGVVTLNNVTTTQTLDLVSVSFGTCSNTLTGSSTVIIGGSTTWNGTSWTNGTPTSTSTAFITGNYTSASNGGSIVACTLSVSNNAIVVISSNTDVTLNGALTVATGSSFTLANNANLLQTTGVANTGNIKVTRNSSAVLRQDYTMWSSPVNNQNLFNFSPLTVVTPTSRFYTYNTSTNFFESIVTPSTVTFATAKGYLIRIRNNQSETVPTSWPGVFTGQAHNGPYTYTMDNLGVVGATSYRYNLIGNPYPSPIDAIRFVDDNAANITGTLYFWRKTNDANAPTYSSWSKVGYDPQNPSSPRGTFVAAYPTIADPLGIVQTAQGFFVEAAGSATSVNFNNAQRINDHANQFFRSASIVSNSDYESHRLWLNVTNTTGAFCQTAVGYFTGATVSYDEGIDAKAINDGLIELYSTADTNKLVIQGRPVPFDATDVVPLGFKATTAGNYSIAIDHLDGLFSGNQDVYLRDNLTGAVHDLKAGAYAFTTDAGTFGTRFDIIYQNALGVNNPVFENAVVIYKQGDHFVINSGNILMDNVKVFDIRGRLLVNKMGINASEMTFNAGEANQVLIVKITSDTNQNVTRKVVN